MTNPGTPLAKDPKPASDPHMASEQSLSSSNADFESRLPAFDPEKRCKMEFMVL